MFKHYKYRLYPNKVQRENLGLQLELHRQLYNAALEQRIRAWKQSRISVSFFDQSKELPALKFECPEFARINQSSAAQTLRRLDKAYKMFFNRNKKGLGKGFPRFRGYGRFNTINYAIIPDGCQIKSNRLYIQHAGLIKVKWHRELPCKPKTLSLTRRNDKWYVNFIVDVEPEILPSTGREIGIDVGLNHFIATRDGETTEAPKYFRKSALKLKRSHQKVSRRKKGSNRRKKAVKNLAKTSEHIANQRRDHAHKVARKLVDENDVIAVEDLKIMNMVRNNRLSKSIHDASWGLFLDILYAKAESAGRTFVRVNPRGTSQRCSACGVTVQKSLAVRVHSCPLCGLVIDRDVNAARKRSSTGSDGAFGFDRVIYGATEKPLGKKSGVVTEHDHWLTIPV